MKPAILLSLALLPLAPLVARGDPPTPASKTTSYQKDVLPFLKTHCYSCHGNGKAKAELSFDKYTGDASLIPDRKVWDNVRDMLKNREMPPPEKPQPKAVEVETVSAAIQELFDRADAAAKPNAGRVTMRRLNRTEYNNTIRDLVGVDFKPADDFPADDVGYGFDNIGDVLSVSPLLLEKYLTAAESVLDQSVVIADPPKPSTRTFDRIYTNSISTAGELGKTISFEAGEYMIRCKVGGDQFGDDPVRVMLRVMGEGVKSFDVKAPADKPEVIETRITFKPGTGRVGVMFLNPSEPKADKKRVLHLKGIETEGPFNPPPKAYPESHTRLMAHDPGLAPREAARAIVTRFATRAFRRPVNADEVERCLTLYDAAEKKGHGFESRVKTALYRVLVSPHFLFRVELDPPGLAPGTNYPINEYELASRLSYFLWNSMPDEELFAHAKQGTLRRNLEPQVRRMVKDPKSQSFLHGFAEQWLTLRKLDLASPDPKLFPTFTPTLREAMFQESLRFFEPVVREDRSVPDLLDADFTFVNEELARHYGIAGLKGSEFVRVTAPAHRGGMLTHASLLTLRSRADRPAAPPRRP